MTIRMIFLVSDIKINSKTENMTNLKKYRIETNLYRYIDKTEMVSLLSSDLQ